MYYIALITFLLSGCVEVVRTGLVTKGNDGINYERQYYVVTNEARCEGSCPEQAKKNAEYWKNQPHPKY